MKNTKIHKQAIDNGTTGAYLVNTLLGVLDPVLQLPWEDFLDLKSNQAFRDRILKNKNKNGEPILYMASLGRVSLLVVSKDKCSYAFSIMDGEDMVTIGFKPEAMAVRFNIHDNNASFVTDPVIQRYIKMGEDFGLLTGYINSFPLYKKSPGKPTTSVVG